MTACGAHTCGNPTTWLWLCNLTDVSLFDAQAVTPPSPCSGCGERVPASSIFCPECGQSTISTNPSPAKVDKVPPKTTDSTIADSKVFERTPDPKASNWLRRSLNFGKKITAGNAENSKKSQNNSPTGETQELPLFDIEHSEQPRDDRARAQRAPVRFILQFDNDMQVTLGEAPGFIGARPPSVQDAPEMHRITLEDPTDTVALDHLEFGIKNGVFWVKDLKTVNGTVVEEPGTRPLQCIPFDKYSLVRGSRITIGAVSFILK